MTKPRNRGDKYPVAEIKQSANFCLAEIAAQSAGIEALEAEAKAALQVLEAEYSARMVPLKEKLKLVVSLLMDTMKSNKATLFDGTDIVRLANGSLIYNKFDKVRIPRDHDAVIALCEELGFDDVVKIAKSLDRDAVEKWPDERLVLIGAERKPKEEFSYDLKVAMGTDFKSVPITGGASCKA